MALRSRRPGLIPLLDEPHPAKVGLIVVAALMGSLWQLDLAARHLLVRNRLEKMGDDVQSGTALVV